MKTNLLEWNDSYAVGITQIDEQHQKLMDMINILYHAFSESSADEVCGEIIKEMFAYTQYHFKTEEDFFHKYNYSDKEAHMAEHKIFVQSVNDFLLEFQNENDFLSYDLMNFLRDWLVNHIKVSDKNYVQELKIKGIK